MDNIYPGSASDAIVVFVYVVVDAGMGIQNPTLTADTEFRNSTVITQNLTTLIENQERNLENYERCLK